MLRPMLWPQAPQLVALLQIIQSPLDWLQNSTLFLFGLDAAPGNSIWKIIPFSIASASSASFLELVAFANSAKEGEFAVFQVEIFLAAIKAHGFGKHLEFAIHVICFDCGFFSIDLFNGQHWQKRCQKNERFNEIHLDYRSFRLDKRVRRLVLVWRLGSSLELNCVLFSWFKLDCYSMYLLIDNEWSAWAYKHSPASIRSKNGSRTMRARMEDAWLLWRVVMWMHQVDGWVFSSDTNTGLYALASLQPGLLFCVHSLNERSA